MCALTIRESCLFLRIPVSGLLQCKAASMHAACTVYAAQISKLFGMSPPQQAIHNIIMTRTSAWVLVMPGDNYVTILCAIRV